MRRKGFFLGALAVLVMTGLAGAGLASPVSAASTKPTLVAIRAAHHPGYDRVVFQFDTALPAKWTVGYVPRVLGDPKGEPVAMSGRYYLEIHFFPATAWKGAGYTTPATTFTALPNVREIARIGDFEGYLSFAIGLDQHVPVRVSTLSAPSRVVVDIPVLAWPMLRTGSRGPDVLAAQYLLRARGYQVVPNGVFDSRTVAAVVAFQRAKGLAKDGVIGPQTWPSLFVTTAAGSKGDVVRAVQVELTSAGHPVAVDGVFGVRTTAAVRSWQSQQWLAVDGIVGPMTWASLVRHVATS